MYDSDCYFNETYCGLDVTSIGVSVSFAVSVARIAECDEWMTAVASNDVAPM